MVRRKSDLGTRGQGDDVSAAAGKGGDGGWCGGGVTEERVKELREVVVFEPARS